MLAGSRSPWRDVCQVAEDQTDSLIDRGYDFAENFVDSVGRVIGVDTSMDRQQQIAPQPRTALPAPAKRVLALPASTFSIVESMDSLGKRTWTVTNGIESADCSSRKIADDVLAALTAKLGGGK